MTKLVLRCVMQGTVRDGADRCTIIHSSFCDGIPFFLAAPGRAFVVPEVAGHQSHPQDQEEH